MLTQHFSCHGENYHYNPECNFSRPGRSPGRAIVLPAASAAASALAKFKSIYVKVFLCDGQGAFRRAFLSLWQVLCIFYTKTRLNKVV